MRIYQAVAASMRKHFGKHFEGKIQNLRVIGKVPKTGESVVVGRDWKQVGGPSDSFGRNPRRFVTLWFRS